MNKQPVIFCFRYDLRLSDNPGLLAAIDSGHPVVLCYVFDNSESNPWPLGGASRWWLHKSLVELQNSLAQHHSATLHLFSGVWEDVLSNLAVELDASAVFWSRVFEPYAAQQERRLAETLAEKGIDAKRFAGALLQKPDSILNKSGEPFKVFTPFWKHCQQLAVAPSLAAPTGKVSEFKQKIKSESLQSWGLLPTSPDWSQGFDWEPGEKGAWAQFSNFAETAMADYGEQRDIPGVTGTSRLSPHFRFGELTPRQVWHRVNAMVNQDSSLAVGAEVFLREVGWREFSYYLLYHWPDLPSEPFKPQFGAFPWVKNAKNERDWQRGQTGVPLVDAGMRELWHTGWMHNRVRMIVASFLVKNLLIPWQRGEDWFWDTLVDADLASNSASWQWVAGSGADAAPYFRIFNPVRQAEKFDPEGTYVKRWVPELKELDAPHIFEPHKAPKSVLTAAGVELGKDYPLPLVDLKISREQALEAYAKIKKD